MSLVSPASNIRHKEYVRIQNGRSAVDSQQPGGEENTVALESLWWFFKCYKYHSWPEGPPPPFGGKYTAEEKEEYENLVVGYAEIDELVERARKMRYPTITRGELAERTMHTLQALLKGDRVDTAMTLELLTVLTALLNPARVNRAYT